MVSSFSFKFIYVHLRTLENMPNSKRFLLGFELLTYRALGDIQHVVLGLFLLFSRCFYSFFPFYFISPWGLTSQLAGQSNITFLIGRNLRDDKDWRSNDRISKIVVSNALFKCFYVAFFAVWWFKSTLNCHLVLLVVKPIIWTCPFCSKKLKLCVSGHVENKKALFLRNSFNYQHHPG